MVDNIIDDKSTFQQNPSAQIAQMAQETARLKREFSDLAKIGDQFSKTIVRSFANAIISGKNFSSILRNITLQISKTLLKNALKPIPQIFTPIIGNISAPLTSQIGNLSNIIPFAKGGIINGPATFQLPGGKTGLAGESGPEAVIPLERAQNGKLGIRTQANTAAQTIIFNITTPDANSFMRSKTQIEAMIARAALRGQRNL